MAVFDVVVVGCGVRGLSAAVAASEAGAKVAWLKAPPRDRTDTRARLLDLGVEAIGNSPDEFAATINRDIAKWAKVIRQVEIRVD
jgi:flavin-dependent dehydrogenase